MWSWSYVWEIMPQLLEALQMTVAATLAGFAAACVIGLVLALLGRSSWRPIAWTTRAVVEFIRNTPLLIQVFFLYYTLPVLTGLTFSAFAIGVFGLGLHYGTYLSEVYRSGIEAVPKGQWEASSALNFSKIQTWTRVILPQAVPPIIPVMGNYLITMFKETPILSAITLVEMLLTAKNIVSESYRVFEPYTIVGVLFLLISYPASLLVRSLEKRMSFTPKVRKEKPARRMRGTISG
ncbi:ectoine/hydroxyectoine ABC transporter permease subunit EhuD [Paenibacillus sp. YYML68]|uniref:ectoine/hydroxyectoine ABC transporter permease subunit EhuD n=1 Tax=Paenibacillus sp. YYML68 TaxID=2909250 RepID=UPI002492E7D0|nr:ectoine/hydroxyectoine ABC transporter permease subunit EhuD [Paenibacillus sp. YYML68]